MIYEIWVPPKFNDGQWVDEWIEALDMAEARRYVAAKYPLSIMKNAFAGGKESEIKIKPIVHIEPENIPDSAYSSHSIVRDTINRAKNKLNKRAN